jgi:hypothetical protein
MVRQQGVRAIYGLESRPERRALPHTSDFASIPPKEPVRTLERSRSLPLPGRPTVMVGVSRRSKMTQRRPPMSRSTCEVCAEGPKPVTPARNLILLHPAQFSNRRSPVLRNNCFIFRDYQNWTLLP